MDSFDIQPPEINAPDWTRVSRAIPEPEHITKADTSLGQTLSTIGEGLGSAVELGKEIQGNIIKEKVRTGVENLRDSYTQALTKLRDQQIAGIAPTTGDVTAAATQTLSAETPAAVPAGLQQGIDKAKALGTAMAQNAGSGKIT